MDYDKEIIDLTLSDDEADEPTPSSSMTKEERELAERVEAVKYMLLSPVDSRTLEEAIIMLRQKRQEAIMSRQQS
ncbi:unnamed protein product [Macrosiphum euphorbiae]|uniref:Uncharacterized protein n=1 Tax=Macrosiphum euphorbiae TaxID=13131 RepID=A0AAV0XBW5_9HEMI|nr:unnamed protein product [Macrosiphum euphorbiae]